MAKVRGLACGAAALACWLSAAAAEVAPASPGSQAAAAAETCRVRKEANVPATMRDGTVLLADIYRPVEPGTYPVLLMRLPYNKATGMAFAYGPPADYAAHCYIVVIQDVRGQYASGGTFYPFRNEMADGYDSVEWAAALPGSSGKVGMYGFSYVGATQWLAATQAPPHLAAIAPGHTSSDYYDGWTYEGGAFSLAFVESWPIASLAQGAIRRLGDQSLVDRVAKAFGDLQSAYRFLPVRGFPYLAPDRPELAGYFYDWLAHPDRDAYWRQWSIRERWGAVQVPALNLAGWYDVFLDGSIENFVGMRREGGSPAARDGQRLVIRPYVHIPWERKSGDVDFGPEAVNTTQALQLRFFDRWLKGRDNGLDREGRVRVFVMGANAWREADEWPIAGTRFTPYYLRSLGQANSSFGNGSLSAEPPPAGEPADHYAYDPADPVPSRGGHSCCFAAQSPQGPYDQAEIEKRADVLVYTTPPLTEPTEVTGPISVTLFAASSAPDTDWTAKLVDVGPDGRAINLNNGIVRASHRGSLEREEPIEPGRVYEYTIKVFPTSNLFAPGHQIRLEISSSNFPHYSRNLNTGRPSEEGVETAIAHQVVFHDAEHPSRLVLPLMPVPIQAAASAAAPR